MQIQTSLNTLNYLTPDGLLRELEENFPPFIPHPSDSTNQIMYKSGQLSVVEWVRNRISQED